MAQPFEPGGSWPLWWNQALCIGATGASMFEDVDITWSRWYEVVRMSMAKWCQICVLLFVMFVTDSLRFQEVNLLKPTMMLMPCKANTTNSTAPWPWPRATNLFGRDGYWTVYWFMDRNERTENQWTSYDIYIHIIHIRIRRVHSSPFISLGNIWYLPCLGVVFSTLTVLEPVLHWIKDPFLQKRENMHRLKWSQTWSKHNRKWFSAHVKSCKCRCAQTMQLRESTENCWTVLLTPGTGHCLPLKNDLIVGRHCSKEHNVDGLLNLCGSGLGTQCKCTIFGNAAKFWILQHPRVDHDVNS